MKTLDAGLAAHLASGITTLAWCWRLTRSDGVVLGFTDHDRDLVVNATRFEAASGFTSSEFRDGVGLAVSNVEVSGALTSSRLSEADFAAGLYDNATVEVFRVNWQQPSQSVLMRRGVLGQVQRGGGGFSAEVRGLAHELQQPKGRLYQHTCDADLGDRRCGVDLTRPPFRFAVTLVDVEGPSQIVASGLGSLPVDWLSRGVLSVASGPGAGFRVEIKRHEPRGDDARITTWQPVPEGLAAGVELVVTAGCDKLLATCHGKFSNAAAFRGFPFMPGNDFVMSYARPGAVPVAGGGS